MARLRTLFYWGPPAAWAAGIFALSSISLPPKPEVFPLQDKVAHFVIFGVLAFLLLRAFRGGQRMSLPRAAVWAFVATSLYGAFDEFHQYFTPARSVDVFDWLSDTLAGTLAFLVLLPKRTGSTTNGHE